MDMDAESWIQGYFTGVALHNHLRTPQAHPSVIASMSATGIAADLEWFADLSGVAALTALSAEFTGNVSASYSSDGVSYTNPVPLPELLRVNPSALSGGTRLWFRFHLADDAADLTNFTLWGVFSNEEAV
ncbi:MAG: hypothetical protein IJR72_01830 [Oscillospiraceae bacterium]|nr:hypothetical protein [Oscillospiraceae bacterium]